jgi:hypothetical protein
VALAAWTAPTLLLAFAPMVYAPAVALAVDVTLNVVLPLAPGAKLRLAAPRVPVHPAGTVRARLKLVAAHAALSLLVRASV